MRSAKLIYGGGEFVCILRDVSDVGISVRMFHTPPSGDRVELQMPGGGSYELRPVWSRDFEAGFEFATPIDVARLIGEVDDFPKRGVRLGLCFPIRITSSTEACEGFVENLSQQGARFHCDHLFAIDQALQIESANRYESAVNLRAKVRWRKDNDYGVVFDDTFTLADFARFAARLQAPGLLD